jgi:hypothetical protein
MQKLLTFLNVQEDPGALDRAIELSSFEAMQSIEEKGGLARFNYHFDEPEARRMRQGRIGGYNEHLSLKEISYLKKTCKSHLTAEARRLLNAAEIAI